MAATYDGKSLFTLRFSWLKICMETGFGWLLGLKEAVAVWVKVCNLKTRPQRKSPPQLVHKIKMASCRMSMDEVAKTYKITPVRRHVPEPTISWCARPSLSVSCMNFWITEDEHGLSEVTQLLPGGELIVF